VPLSERYQHQVALLIETLAIRCGGNGLRSQRRDRDQSIRARYAAFVSRYRPDLPACSRAAGIAGRDRCGHEKNGCCH
jgi:hypothetical protein